MAQKNHPLNRRHFLKKTAAGIGAVAVGTPLADAAGKKKADPGQSKPPADAKDLIWRNKAQTMEYRRLGRTNFMASRIVIGCGSNEAILRRLLSRGVNYFDTARGYGNQEVKLGGFLKKYRDKLWITSKATSVAGTSLDGNRKINDQVRTLYLKAIKAYLGDEVYGNILKKSKGPLSKFPTEIFRFHVKTIEKQKMTGEKPDFRPVGKLMAELYLKLLDESLERAGIDHFDAYFMHCFETPWMYDCLEVWEAIEKAHKAGKIKHFGFSVHRNTKEVLAATIEANRKGPWKVDLIMAAANPESFDDYKPELAALKKQDVGIIAMKTKGIANRPVDGREKKFKSLTEGKEYNEWERAKLWMLHLTEGLINACIASVANNDEMERTLALPLVKLSSAAKRELRAVVKLEMAGICHLCGQCSTVCPEHIAVTDMIRYHAYIHQYNDKKLARELYARSGYDPSNLCSNCGQCEQVCRSQVPITKLLHRLPNDLA